MRSAHAGLAGTLLALLAASLFGMLGPLSRFAADAGLGAIGFVAWRAGIGALALAVGMGAVGGLRAGLGSIGALDRRGRGSLGLAAVMGFTLNLAIFIAFGRITIVLALMLFYTYPTLVATVGMATGHEPLTRPKGLALGAASIGVVLVLIGGLDASAGVQLDLLGVALAFSSALSQTVFITVSRHGYSAVPAEAATLAILLASAVGAVATALVAGVVGELLQPVRSLDTWPIVLIAGILAAALPSLLFLSSIRRIGGTRTGILMLWEPVVGVVLAALLLGEALVPVQVAGGALVLVAAAILQLTSDPETEPVAPTVDVI